MPQRFLGYARNDDTGEPFSNICGVRETQIPSGDDGIRISLSHKSLVTSHSKLLIPGHSLTSKIVIKLKNACVLKRTMT